MKKMVNYIILFLITILVIGIDNKRIQALQNADSCLDEGKCMILCTYGNQDVNVFYKYDGTFIFKWGTRYSSEKSPSDKLKDVFVSSSTYTNLLNSGICPSRAYIDSNWLNGGNEICLDFGKYCETDKPGGAGTSWSKYKNLAFDFSDKLRSYFDQYTVNYTCKIATTPLEEELYKDCDPSKVASKYNLVCTSVQNCDVDKMIENIENDMMTKFFNNHEIPSIITNNKSYMQGIDKIKNLLQSARNELIKDTTHDSNLSDGKKSEQINTINQKFDEAIENFEKFIDDNSEAKIEWGEEFTDETICEVVPEEIKKWIINILKVVRYIALALVIVLGALDFMKAAGSGEPDQMKKAGQSFLKRVIAVAVLFLLPYIVELVLGLIDMFGVKTNCIDPGSI